MNEIEVTGMPITLEKSRLNLFNATGFILGVIAQVVIGTAIWVNLNRDVAEIRQSQIERGALADRNNEEIRAQIAPVPQMKFQQDQQAAQIADLKTQVIDMNKRFDRMIELVSGKLDSLGENLNNLRTDVKVLAQEVRSNSDKAQKTMLAR